MDMLDGYDGHPLFKTRGSLYEEERDFLHLFYKVLYQIFTDQKGDQLCDSFDFVGF